MHDLPAGKAGFHFVAREQAVMAGLEHVEIGGAFDEDIDHRDAARAHPLLQAPDREPHYLLVLKRETALDTLEVRVEARSAVAEAGKDALAALGAVARRKIYEVIGVTVEVTVVPPKTIERSVGKAQRVLDLRK